MENIDKIITCSNYKFIIEKNPQMEEILILFVIYDPTIIKYTYKFEKNINSKSKNVFTNHNNYKCYYNFEFPVFLMDVVTNIQCNINNTELFFHYNQKIRCNISNLTLPLCNMMYCPVNLHILLPDNINDATTTLTISFDVCVLNNKLRKKLREKHVANDEKLFFKNGTFYGYKNS